MILKVIKKSGCNYLQKHFGTHVNQSTSSSSERNEVNWDNLCEEIFISMLFVSCQSSD